MKKYKTLIIIFIISLLVLQKCTFLNSNKEIKIVNQELLYDSLFKSKKRFDVGLYTTLDFDYKNVSKNDYTDFLVIINKDTFPLIPEGDDLEKINKNEPFKIRYFSQINFSSLSYNNDSLSKRILENSKIIDKEGKEILRDKNYEFKSLIKFHKIKKDGIKIE